MADAPAPSLTLLQVAGPADIPAGPFVIPGADPPTSTTIGRVASCDISLLSDAVSRRHAMIIRRRADWFVIDEGSSGGTFINGVRIPRSIPAPIATGDLLRIGPWTFRAAVGITRSHAAPTIDDSRGSTLRVQRANSDRGQRSERRLRLLSECIARLNTAATESAAARFALESALMGSGYARGAVLRRADTTEVEVIASHRADPSDTESFNFSRTLIDQANAGETVLLTGGSPAGQYGHSLAELEIHSALCVPIGLGGSITGYLYLDARGRESHVRADASSFCESLATAYGLAVANIQRGALLQRQAHLHAELNAAREVQQLVMPTPQGEVGCLSYAMRSLPGSFVAGDLFEVVDVAGEGAALCIGDVSGHGVGSAMLMATAQSFLSAELRRLQPGQEPSIAVEALNRYLCERPLAGRFLSLWVGVLMPDGTLTFVDAGHGHWAHVHKDQSVTGPGQSLLEGGIPIGIDPEARFSCAMTRVLPGERIILYSDGITEQRNQSGEHFGVPRLWDAVRGDSTPARDITRLFDALARFSPPALLDDDATAVSLSLTPT